MQNLDDKLKQAREISWDKFGKTITAYLPGMFNYNGLKGRYPALSITGTDCELQCDHCKTSILKPMPSCKSPEQLIKKALKLSEAGNHGILISGGCDSSGRLPWEGFIPAIKEIKKKTDLFVSIHSGLIDQQTAIRLKGAGVDQALIDVIGDDETFQDIYHVDFGVSKIQDSMEALNKAGIPIIPHVVCGLHYGEIKGERKALEIISRFNVEQLVIVSLMVIPGTPLQGTKPVEAEEVAEIIADARIMMPDVRISLGCARRRGDSRLEILAIDAGINRIAIPSEEALEHAEEYGLEIRYQKTCCSVSRDISGTEW